MLRLSDAFVALVILVVLIVLAVLSLLSCRVEARITAEGHILTRHVDSGRYCLVIVLAHGDTVTIATTAERYQVLGDVYARARVGRDTILSRRQCITPPNWFQRWELPTFVTVVEPAVPGLTPETTVIRYPVRFLPTSRDSADRVVVIRRRDAGRDAGP